MISLIRRHTLVKSIIKLQNSNSCLIRFVCNRQLSSKICNQNEVSLNPPRGTRDFHPLQMKLREQVFELIIDCFKLHGAVCIDTPVIERKEILLNKYGEDSKLIYAIQDESEGDLALRYDLTVPFARYLAHYQLTNLKRYQLGRVYRRDRPNLQQGRYREFMQCDFDIASNNLDPMLAEVECLKLICEILNKLGFENQYLIKINHRNLINGIFRMCGLSEDKFKTASSAIDKLDKMNWPILREELIKQREINEDVVDKIGKFISLKGNASVLDEFKKHNTNSLVAKGLEDLILLEKYSKLLKISQNIEFNMSLMRGLDYYTGAIYEVILTNSSYGIGSVAAGGRYDNLVNLFNSKQQIQCVGLSIGVERLLRILELKEFNDKNIINEMPIDVDVFVATPQKGFTEERLRLCEELWSAGFKTEHSYKNNPKLLNQLQYCEKYSIPYCVLIGESELKNGLVKLRNVKDRIEDTIERENLVIELKKRLQK